MKIEIEFEEVERYRNEVTRLERAVGELEQKLKDAQPEEMEEKAVALAQFLFRKYMNATFSQLGFESEYNYNNINFDADLNRLLGKRWWNKADQIKVTLAASLTNHLWQAFLRIGVNISEEKMQKEDNLLTLV